MSGLVRSSLAGVSLGALGCEGSNAMKSAGPARNWARMRRSFRFSKSAFLASSSVRYILGRPPTFLGGIVTRGKGDYREEIWFVDGSKTR